MSVISNLDIVSNVKDIGVQKCSQWLLEHAKTLTISVSENKTYDAFCRRVYEKYKWLSKNKNKDIKNELEQFLSLEVQYPKPLESSKIRNREKLENIRFLQEKSESLLNVASDLAEDLNASRSENTSLKHDVQELQRNYRLKLSKVGNIKKLKKDLRESKARERVLLKENNCLKLRLSQKVREIKRLRLRVTYAESSCEKKCNKINGKVQEIEHLKEELELKQQELNIQHIHCKELETQN